MTVALAVPLSSVKNRDVRFSGHVRLIGRIRYILLPGDTTISAFVSVMKNQINQ